MPGDGRAASTGRDEELAAYSQRRDEDALSAAHCADHQDTLGKQPVSTANGSEGAICGEIAGSLSREVPCYDTDDVSHCTVGCITE